MILLLTPHGLEAPYRQEFNLVLHIIETLLCVNRLTLCLAHSGRLIVVCVWTDRCEQCRRGGTQCPGASDTDHPDSNRGLLLTAVREALGKFFISPVS